MKTSDQVRRENLSSLRQEYEGVGNLAKQIGVAPSQLSQWLNGSTNSGTGKPRGISDEACRTIEAACQKEVGWMDADADLIRIDSVEELFGLFLRASANGRASILIAARDAEKRE